MLRQAVSSERLRIAQELHDVVAHAMSVIAVQSGMGAHVIDTQPDEAKKALQAIETTSRARSTSSAECSACCARKAIAAARSRRCPVAGDVHTLIETVCQPGCRWSCAGMA